MFTFNDLQIYKPFFSPLAKLIQPNKEGVIFIEDIVIKIVIAVLVIGVIIAIIKKVAKYIIVIGIVAVIALALIGASMQNKPLQDLTVEEWKQITTEQYNKYREEIEANPEVQAVYTKLVETSDDIADKAKEKVMAELIKELEKLADGEGKN